MELSIPLGAQAEAALATHWRPTSRVALSAQSAPSDQRRSEVHSRPRWVPTNLERPPVDESFRLLELAGRRRHELALVVVRGVAGLQYGRRRSSGTCTCGEILRCPPPQQEGRRLHALGEDRTTSATRRSHSQPSWEFAFPAPTSTVRTVLRSSAPLRAQPSSFQKSGRFQPGRSDSITVNTRFKEAGFPLPDSNASPVARPGWAYGSWPRITTLTSSGLTRRSARKGSAGAISRSPDRAVTASMTVR